MFGWFFGKKEVKRIEEETKRGFESVKKDIYSVSEWIKHLDTHKKIKEDEIKVIKEDLSSMRKDIEELRELIFPVSNVGENKVFKQLSKKQTAVYPVQTAVQTAVQTPNFDDFSISEKSIIWILLNSEMKLSYDDLAVMMGKERSTIRGQINTIKQKNRELIEEIIEKNGKKRVFVPKNVKEKIIKKQKVRVKEHEKSGKKEKIEVKNKKKG